MTEQYYLIKFRSENYFDCDEKIAVNSIKELKQFVSNKLQNLISECPKLEGKLKKPYYHKMYMDLKDGGTKIVGKTITYGLKRSDESLTYWCEKIPKSKLYQFAGFDEVNQ